jgi:Gram-negative bacterial TonB protein C-terminal
MNKYYLIFVAFICTTYLQAQNIATPDSTPIDYETVEQRPIFPGGNNEFMKFISKNFVVPEEEGISGTILLSFIIETDGKVSNIKIIKDIGNGAGESAKRAISKSPNWQPGEEGGKIVRVIRMIPIKIN